MEMDSTEVWEVSHWVDENALLRRQLVEVTQQRDGLVKVLKRLPKVNKDIYIGKSKISYAQEVQAAIAKLGADD